MKNFILFILIALSSHVINAQCTDPSGLNIIGTSETTATFGWTENGSALDWEYEIVLSGATPTGTGTAINANPYTVDNLISGENYDVYLRSNCLANGYSNWIGPVNLTTISCIFTIDALESTDNCLEYCFFPIGSQFGTFFDFNSGVLPTGWNSSPYAVGTPCITDMVDNSPYFWATTLDSNGYRQVTTNTLDVSLGGIIQFYMRYGADDPDPGCETADLPEEGVRLQYSINNGATWVDINYWIPTDILTDPLYSWTQYTENIPVAAQTANTLFRWFQQDNSGSQYDNWGLDNVLVSANTNANYLWDFGDGNTSTLATPCHSYATEGNYNVTLTVNSPNCNASASTSVNAEDNLPPTVICQDITIDLDNLGNASITASDIDDGSFDACGIQSLNLSQTNFNCSDVGNNSVILSVTDIYGNTETCTATVTVNPSYPAPQNITISSITATNAIIDWLPGGTETSWNIEIIPAGTTPTGTGTIVNSIPYTVSNLTANTDYDVYIQAVSNTGCSDLAGPETFSTPCVTLSVPYVEPVETQLLGNASLIDNCWSAVDSNYEWRANSFGTASIGTGPNAAANGTNYFYTEASSPANTGDVAILLSPIFDLTTSTNTVLHFNYHMYGSAMGELHVDLYDGLNWVQDVFVLNGQQQSSNSSAWLNQVIDISSYETVSNFQVRFRGIRGSSYTSDMAIDDITIESMLPCPEPINFTASNPTATTIDLNWTEVGSAISWEIEAVPTGMTPTGSGITVNTMPYTYSGLNINTTYDFYISAICSSTSMSNWVGPVTLATVCDDFSFDFCPQDITIETDAGQCYAIPNFSIPTITDNCDPTNTSVTLLQGFNPDQAFPIGTTTVEYTASNSVGTTIFCQFDVTVQDPFIGLQLQSSVAPDDNDIITLCNEDTTTLTLTGGNFDGTETYQWYLDNTIIPNQTSNTINNVNDTGEYQIEVSLGTCSQVYVVDINHIIANPDFEVSAIACEGANFNVTGTQGGSFMFETTPFDGAMINPTTGEIYNANPGETYEVRYTTPQTVCQEFAVVSVTLLPLDDASFELDEDNLFCYSAKMIVTGTTEGTFSFNPEPNDGAVINPETGEVSNTQPNTYYTVQYTTNDVCSNTEFLTYLTPENCIIPQGISPNGDEYNEYFEVSWLEATKITIYNRYGKEVYSKVNYRNEWNGITNTNEPLPTGTYYYCIELPEDKPVVGWVYVNR